MKSETITVSGTETRLSEPKAEPPKVICDLAEANAFFETYGRPHVPIMSVFGAGRLHTCRLMGAWNLDKAAAENAGALMRSIRRLPAEGCQLTPAVANSLTYQAAKDEKKEWDDLTFQLGPRAFIYMDKNRIVGFADTAEEAESLVAKFGAAYSQPPSKSKGGDYYLIQQEPTQIQCHRVSLPEETVLTDESIAIHYGPEVESWHQDYVKKLRAKDRGLSIFEGVPGTGKTFYIRHLMGVLKQSHRFYFIPTSSLSVLTRSDFIGFWAEQRQQFSNRQLVVVLEDSDAALMTRGSDNREQVSAILNLTDGLLADFLRLQIICTINCTAADIDPALLRPGRLISHRVFGRLNYAHALRLAEKLGRKLPVANDFSLAEIFSDAEKPQAKRAQIGFGA